MSSEPWSSIISFCITRISVNNNVPQSSNISSTEGSLTVSTWKPASDKIPAAVSIACLTEISTSSPNWSGFAIRRVGFSGIEILSGGLQSGSKIFLRDMTSKASHTSATLRAIGPCTAISWKLMGRVAPKDGLKLGTRPKPGLIVASPQQ